MLYPIKKLWEICSKITDWTHSTPKYIETWIPFLSVKDITKGFIDFSNTRFISKEEHEKLIKRCKPEFWDILYTKVWTTWYAKSIDVDNEFSIFVSLALLKFDKKILNTRYFEYILNSRDVYNQSQKWTRWVTNKNLVIRDIKEIQIPLPPLPTQKLITQKLDQSFEKIDKSIQLTKKNLENIEELNKSALEKAFWEGEFEEKTIDEISEKVQYWYTWKTIEDWKVKYLRITDVQNNNIIRDNVPFVDIKESEISKYSLNKWDIVFARTWATVWKSCLIDEKWIWNIFASYLIRIVSKKELIFPNYIQYFFYSESYWKQIWIDTVWAAQPNFNWTKLKKITIPLPPLQTQKQITTHLNQIFQKNTKLKQHYQNKLKNLQKLKQSLLKQAFENESFVEN